MSYQTTMARAAAREAEQEWRWHWKVCPRCRAAAGARRWLDLCGEGAVLRDDAQELRASARREAELDRQVPRGQGALFDVGDLA